MTQPSARLLSRVSALRWYHCLELAPGIVTPGMFDLRPYVARYRLPESLAGARALDVGTFDGFWAFELERRGAEVVALDVDDPAELDYPPRRRPATAATAPRGAGFELAHEVLGSNVERVACNLYKASPERLGKFDLILSGSVVMHVRDQLLALERMSNLLNPGGLYIASEEYDLWSNFVPFPVVHYLADRESSVIFWLPSIRTWKKMMWSAGFDTIEVKERLKLSSQYGFAVRHAIFHATRDEW